jgi:tRNA-Thr(GGU) m(6)t(6)A37 methyltransferase TsaA
MENIERNEGSESLKSIEFTPIGVVRNQSREVPWGTATLSMDWQDRVAAMQEQGRAVSELIINPELENLLDGIDEFSHLMVLYWSHLIPDERRMTPKVHPLGSEDFPLVGTLATHSPARPNSILVTVVRLLGRKGTIFTVTGLDALDGSPILDIKPYLPEQIDPKELRMPDWMHKTRDRFNKGLK